MINNFIFIISWVLVMSLIFSNNKAYCFDDQVTHPQLIARAADEPIFRNYLINELGLPEGIDHVIAEKTILQWLQKGSTDEDQPPCRASTHFHNPLLTWDNSYNTDAPEYISIWCHNVLPAWTPYSNINWATGYTSLTQLTPEPRDRQDMGWDNARTYFYQALTYDNEVDREDNFIKTFSAVGQVLHLLQDMAVPAHVRNDFQSHLIFQGIRLDTKFTNWWANPFEYYVKQHKTLVSSVTPAVPTFTNPRLTDFWDTIDSVGNSPGIGLAEIVNRNYFSDQTIPGNNTVLSDPYYNVHMFPLPQLVSGTYDCVDKLPETNKRTRYVSRKLCPVPEGSGNVDHFVAYSFLTSEAEIKALTANPNLRKYVLDDNVHNTYATGSDGLLSKAVGYSAALLDYFFRGNIKLTFQPDDVTFRSVKVTTQNNTPGEIMGTGEARLVIRYKALAETALGGNKYLLNNPSDEYSYKVSKPLNVDLINPQELTFDFSDNPLPYFFDDTISMQLVFKGKLGNEDNAVAVSSFQPIDAIFSDFDLSLPPSGVYAKTTDGTLNATFNELRVTAQTDIPGGLSGGQIQLALEYRQALDNPFMSQSVPTGPTGAVGYIIRVPEKNGVSSLPQGVPVDLVFDLSTAQLPAYATDVHLNVIYTDTGTSKTIGVGYSDISEPTPIDVFNNCDKVCINKQWYTAGSIEAIAQVDTNHDGIADEVDVYNHNIQNIFEKASPASSLTGATPSNYTFQSPELLSGGSFRRLGFILTDYSFDNSFREEWVETNQDDPWATGVDVDIYHGQAVKNQTNANGGRTFPGMSSIRGFKMWGGAGIAYVNTYDEDTQCGWGSIPQ